MLNHHSDKHLKIKKGQLWELWLESPALKVILGAFRTLEELNQVEITLYHAWEKARYPQGVPVDTRWR